MQSLAELATAWKAGYEGHAGLSSLAAELLRDVPGTAGRMEVRLGNEFQETPIPASLYPFLLLALGSEKERADTAAGELIRREFRVTGGIRDPDAERATLRSIEFEEVLAAATHEILAGLVIDPERNPAGLIRGYRMKPLVSDEDFFRPCVLRILPVEVAYVLE